MDQLASVLRSFLGASKPDYQSGYTLLTEGGLDCARANKVSVLVARTLEIGEQSEAIRAGLVQDQNRASLSNAHLLHLIHLTSGALGAAGIPHFFYKGPVQQKTLYGDFFAKQSSDADFMVRKVDFDRARDVLTASGFNVAPTCRGPWWRHFLGEQHLFHGSQKGHSLDLHYKLQQPGCPAPARPDRFFRALSEVTLGSGKVPTLGLAGVAMVAAMNLVKAIHHREPAGSYAVDLLMTLRRMTTQELTELRDEARRQKLTKTVAVAARASSIAFGLPDLFSSSVVRLPAPENFVPGLVLCPVSVPKRTLKRSYLLFCLCDDGLPQFANESVRWGLSEACRIMFQKD